MLERAALLAHLHPPLQEGSQEPCAEPRLIFLTQETWSELRHWLVTDLRRDLPSQRRFLCVCQLCQSAPCWAQKARHHQQLWLHQFLWTAWILKSYKIMFPQFSCFSVSAICPFAQGLPELGHMKCIIFLVSALKDRSWSQQFLELPSSKTCHLATRNPARAGNNPKLSDL